MIHFAAYIAVGESMKAPEDYFHNNVAGSLSLFTAMVRAGVKALVFSSTAAVYGMPATIPIPEDSPYAAVNPYGESKVMVEKMLGWFDLIHGLRSVCLRYFNASGAEEKGRVGERHEPETHLIPLMFRAIQTGEPVTLFGDDYDTPDGTCIRDYIHVSDLAQAHVLAVESLLERRRVEPLQRGHGQRIFGARSPASGGRGDGEEGAVSLRAAAGRRSAVAGRRFDAPAPGARMDSAAQRFADDCGDGVEFRRRCTPIA